MVRALTYLSSSVVAHLTLGAFAHPRFRRTPQPLRKKIDKATWEHEAELAALASNLCREVRGLVPIDEAVLEELLDKFVGHIVQARNTAS